MNDSTTGTPSESLGQPDKALEQLRDQLAANHEEISQLSASQEAIEAKLQLLDSKIQANIDLTDDIVGLSSNIIQNVENRVSQTLANSDQVLASAHELIDVYLVVFTAAAALVGWFITFIVNRRHQEQLDRALREIAKRFNNDENFMSDFASEMMKDDNFKENLQSFFEKFGQPPADEQPEDIKSLKNDLT